MIIVCGGIKGGSGKTTVAVNLAVLRAAAGREVLLVDADDQASATTFTAVREEALGNAGYVCVQLRDEAVGRQVRKLAEKYSDIVVDTGGRDTKGQRSALMVANLVLVPFKPRSMDIWTLGRIDQIIQDAQGVNQQLRASAFLSQADARGHDNGEAGEILRQAAALRFVEPFLTQRKAFGNAAAMGLGVCELQPEDEKASGEMRALYAYVFDTGDIYALNAGGALMPLMAAGGAR